MSLSENLYNLRKMKNMSQEELAEKLDVSRQAVSKWEGGNGYPETEKIISICEIFNCSMDDLVKGKISADIKSEKEEYEKVMNRDIKGKMFGVTIILLGVTIMMIIMGFVQLQNGELEERYSMLGIISVLIGVAIAVPTFIITGRGAEDYRKNNEKISNIYSLNEIESLKNKITICKAVGVCSILIGVIIMLATIGLKTFGDIPQLSVACLLGCITIAMPFLIYGGQMEEKIDIEKYNLGHTKEAEKNQKLTGSICGTIMLIATSIFLVWSFTTNRWDISWVVFPVGGMLCGIVGIIFDNKNINKDNNKED